MLVLNHLKPNNNKFILGKGFSSQATRPTGQVKRDKPPTNKRDKLSDKPPTKRYNGLKNLPVEQQMFLKSLIQKVKYGQGFKKL